jgi:hypothetical protein
MCVNQCHIVDLPDKVLNTVYDDLSLSRDVHQVYCQPDGSYNNTSDPTMGNADLPYARSVQQTHPLPRNMLPDAGLVFDSLLKRKKVRPLVILIFLVALTCTVSICQVCHTWCPIVLPVL